MSVQLHELEHVRDVYRQSRWVLVEPIALSILGIIAPWYFVWSQGMLASLQGLLIFWSTALSLYILRKLIIWQGNRYIVTNQRLIKIAKHGLLDKSVIETPLDRILNVSYHIKLPFPYGDVDVQVVGLVDPIVLKKVPQPGAIQDYILQLHARTASDRKFDPADIEHVQERVGYTKKRQKHNK